MAHVGKAPSIKYVRLYIKIFDLWRTLPRPKHVIVDQAVRFYERELAGRPSVGEARGSDLGLRESGLGFEVSGSEFRVDEVGCRG